VSEITKSYPVPRSNFDDYNGICLNCGEMQYGGVEPDARRYHCEACGEESVYGLPEALVMDRVTVQEED
jgi:hypothetical protein